MESIYYVLTWLCHRRCVHCYDDRFRPYSGGERDAVLDESRSHFPRIIENLPARMTFLDPLDTDDEGKPREKRGRIIVAGGEVTLAPVRKSVLYPALDLLHEKYSNAGGVDLIVQTTGDTLTEKILDGLLAHHVTLVSVSGVDSYHEGLETDAAQRAVVDTLTPMFEARGMTLVGRIQPQAVDTPPGGPYFHFFGATPDSWIGPLWPRGRAQDNELSTATFKDNYCNAWSGGLNFLNYKYAGSEVSVEPNGAVYPCCIKTKKPIGSLLENTLEELLDRCVGDPVYEAIAMGHPERMGIQHGWSVETFLEKSRVTLPSGRVYENLCIGCDRFHEEVLLKK